MLCTPWQLAQLATVCEPALAARPWKEESKLTMRSAGRPNLRVSRTSPWQLPQVSRMCAAFTGEAALVCLRMLCSPWQSVHSGACVTPRASAWPCTLARNCSTTSLWHIPQVSGTAVRNSADFGFSSSWAPPWQTEQSGAPGVAGLGGLPVHAVLVGRGLVLVAGRADRFGHARRVRDFLMLLVAGIAREARVGASGELLAPARGSWRSGLFAAGLAPLRPGQQSTSRHPHMRSRNATVRISAQKKDVRETARFILPYR